jgi:hypothetical protein
MEATEKRTRGPRKIKALDDEIAAAEATLAKLRAAKKEKERREQEENTEAIVALLKKNGWNGIGVDRWLAVAREIDGLLRPNEGKTEPSANEAAAPEAEDQRSNPKARAV